MSPSAGPDCPNQELKICGAWLSKGNQIWVTYSSLPLCRSDDDGFPAIDYNDVYKIKDTLAQDEFLKDLPEAEVASLGSISIADAEVELADFDAASEDSVFWAAFVGLKQSKSGLVQMIDMVEITAMLLATAGSSHLHSTSWTLMF